MFNQLPTSSHISLTLPLKLIAGGATGLVLAFGLCGIDQYFYPNSEFGGSVLALLGAASAFFSIIAIAVGLLILLVKVITNIFTR